MRRIWVLLSLFGLSIAWPATGRSESGSLTVVTLPFDQVAEQRAVFAMLSRYLSSALDQPVRFHASNSYEAVIAALATGEADVAIMGAAAYVEARKRGHVRAILRCIRHQQATYVGVIVVPRRSPISRLSQLKGTRVALVDKFSSSGYLFPRLLMEEAGLEFGRDIQPVFVGAHHTVVEWVAAGKSDAGACFAGAEASLPDHRSVRIIARTEAIPGDPVVVRPGLGQDLVRRLRSALIEMATVPEARPFFEYSEIDGFLPALDRDYDRVAELVLKNPR